MKPTVTSEVRKTGQKPEQMRDKSVEFVKQAKEHFEETHTFKPRINPGKQSATDHQISKEERWRRLTEPKAEQ